MEIPTDIDLEIDQTYTLRLPEQGTTGYLWSYEVIENTDVVNVFESMITGGSSTDKILTIQALKAGHSTIRLINKRSWEDNKLAIKKYIEINVKD